MIKFFWGVIPVLPARIPYHNPNNVTHYIEHCIRTQNYQSQLKSFFKRTPKYLCQHIFVCLTPNVTAVPLSWPSKNSTNRVLHSRATCKNEVGR